MTVAQQIAAVLQDGHGWWTTEALQAALQLERAQIDGGLMALGHQVQRGAWAEAGQTADEAARTQARWYRWRQTKRSV